MPRGSKYADYGAFNLPIDEQMNNRMGSDLAGQLGGKILSGSGPEIALPDLRHELAQCPTGHDRWPIARNV